MASKDWTPVDFRAAQLEADFFDANVLRVDRSQTILSPLRFHHRPGEGQKGGWLSGVGHMVSFSTVGGTCENVRAVAGDIEEFALAVVMDANSCGDLPGAGGYYDQRRAGLSNVRHNLVAHNAYLDKYNSRFMLSKSKLALHVKSIHAVDAELEKLRRLNVDAAQRQGSTIVPQMVRAVSMAESESESVRALKHTVLVLEVILERIDAERTTRAAEIDSIALEEEAAAAALEGVETEKAEVEEELQREVGRWSSVLGESAAVSDLKRRRGLLENKHSELVGQLVQIREFLDASRKSLLALEKEKMSVQKDLAHVRESVRIAEAGGEEQVSSASISTRALEEAEAALAVLAVGDGGEPSAQQEQAAKAACAKETLSNFSQKSMEVVRTMKNDVLRYGSPGLLQLFEVIILKVGEGSGYVKNWTITDTGLFALQMTKPCHLHIPVKDPKNIGSSEPKTGAVFTFGCRISEHGQFEMNGRLDGQVVGFSNGCSTLSRLPKKYDNFIIRKIVGSPVHAKTRTIRVDNDGKKIFFTMESCGQVAEVDEDMDVLLNHWRANGKVVQVPESAI